MEMDARMKSSISQRAGSQARMSRIPKFQPERIIFCVDLCNEMNEIMFAQPPNREMTRIENTKRLLHRFIQMKRILSKQHEFAFVFLTNKAEWHMDYSNDEMMLSLVIDELCATGDFKYFETSSLFETLIEHTPRNAGSDFIYRAILIYGRSRVMPRALNEDLMRQLYGNSSFYLDVIYLHERSSALCRPQEIYDKLTEFESPYSTSYFFEISRRSERYSLTMAQLLGNPRQRVLHETVDYTIRPDETPNPERVRSLERPSAPESPERAKSPERSGRRMSYKEAVLRK